MADAGNAMDIGHKLLACFALCRDNVPHDLKDKSALNLLIAKAGVSSWRKFHKAAVSVSAYRNKGDIRVELLPGRRDGPGTSGMMEKTRWAPSDPESLGKAVVAALQDAE